MFYERGYPYPRTYDKCRKIICVRLKVANNICYEGEIYLTGAHRAGRALRGWRAIPILLEQWLELEICREPTIYRDYCEFSHIPNDA